MIGEKWLAIAETALKAVERHMDQVDCSCSYDLDSVCWFHMSESERRQERIWSVAMSLELEHGDAATVPQVPARAFGCGVAVAPV